MVRIPMVTETAGHFKKCFPSLGWYKWKKGKRVHSSSTQNKKSNSKLQLLFYKNEVNPESPAV